MEKLYRERLNWKQDPNDFSCINHSAIWGEHLGVYTIVYEHNVHLNYEYVWFR